MAMAGVLVVASFMGLQIAQVASAPPAAAAPGDSFDQGQPTVFISSGVGSPTLFRASFQDDGTLAFTPEGVPGPSINSIAYNTVDNFIYATDNNTNQVIRIGQGGVIVDSAVLNAPISGAAGGQNIGLILPGTSTMILGLSSSPTYYVADLVTGAVETRTFSEAPGVNDMTFKDGFLWGFRAGGSAVRANPTTGQIDVFPGVIASTTADAVGSMWTYGNGNLGLLRNLSGTALQIAIADPGGANPTFTVVSRTTGPTSTNNDGTAAPGLPTDMSIEKTGPAVLTAGGAVTYSLTVTNNGVGASSGSTVSDTLPDSITGLSSSVSNCSFTGQTAQCLMPPLAAGATFTFTISGTVAAGTTGTVTNTATVTGNEQDPTPDNNTSVTSGQFGAITIDKTAGTPVDTNADGIIDAGDTIPFSFLVTNAGGTTLTGVTVDDAMLADAGVAIACPVTELAAGASTTCTADYTITAADAAAGTVNNTATASGVDPGGVTLTSTPDSTETPVVAAAPAITVDKTHEAPVDTNGSGLTDAGDTIQYTFTVTNTGNTILQDVQVDDPLVGAVTCDPTTLAVGATANCRADAVYVVTDADEAAGAVNNTATVTGTPPGGTDVTATDTDTAPVAAAAPALTLDKVAGTPTDVNASGFTDAGDTIQYTFTVTNTGNVPVTAVAVTDPLVGAVACDVTTLAVGETATCAADAVYVITDADEAAGAVNNTATATGNDPDGTPVDSPPDSTTTVVTVPAPALTLDKVAGTPTDVNASGITDAGDTIQFSFTVTNTGNVPVSAIAVTDPLAGAVTCDVTALAVGASATCAADAVYVITDADEVAGAVNNTATATGNDPDGTPLDSPPDSTTTVVTVPAPALTLDKVAGTPTDVNASGITDAGDTIQYTFTVTNSGNVPVSAVSVTDPLAGAVTCDVTTLAVGATATCAADAVYVITDADEVAGAVNNTATATGNDPDGTPVDSPPDSTTTVVTVPAPALTLDKAAGTPTDVNASGITDAGDTIQYTFTVTNSGNVPVSAIAVTDPLVGAVTCDVTALAVGASAACTADAVYVITDADQAAGAVNNTATATGNDPDGTPVDSPPDSTTTVVTVPDPGIEIDKQAGDLVDANNDGKVTPGDTIEFSFTVTNTGNVTLNDIVVNDEMLGGELECPQITLLAGESMECTAVEYAITQADIDKGSVDNLATVTGTPPSGPPTGGDDTTETPTPGIPGLSLVKTAQLQDKDGDGFGDSGEVVTYTFVIENVGTITIENIGVDDPMLAKAGITARCDDSVLAPGASTTCSADYTITKADALADSIRNVATATGTPPNCDGACDPVVSPPDDATVTTEGKLANTGGAPEWPIVVMAMFLIAGGVLLVARRRNTA